MARNTTHSIKFEGNEAQIALVKQMGSKNRAESMAAQEAVANVIATPLLQVIETAPVIANLFQNESFDEGTPATLPLDVYFDVRQRGYLQVWTSTTAGGLAYSMPVGVSELPVLTYELQGAVALKKSYLRAARLNVLAASFERLGQEVLKKQDINAANILMASLANAVIPNRTGDGSYHVIRAATATVLQMDDLNALMIKFARVNSSWVGGTPAAMNREITDLIMSPEGVGQIRSLAYQPVNTRQATSGVTSIPAPEALREEIYKSGGIPTLYGKSIIEVYELGNTGQSQNGEYSTIFKSYAGSNTYSQQDGSTSSAVYLPASQDLVIGLNLNGFNLVRLRQNGKPSAFTLAPDDQFYLRQDTVGWFGGVVEGYVSADARQSVAMIW
jgi:hypothetical protein